MIKNYILIAYRSLVRDKFFSLLNIFGLTVGITAFLLIALYVRFELSFDQFHEKGDRVRAYQTAYQGAEGASGSDRLSIWGGMALEEHIPEIEGMVQLAGGYSALISVDREGYYEDRWYYSDNSIFEVFDFPILRGNPRLDEITSVVITESIAQKYFGDEDPIGKSIKREKEEEYIVSAIAADPPANSYIQFDILFSDKVYLKRIAESEEREYNKWGKIANTYFLLAEGTDDATVISKMIDVAEEHFTSGLFRTDDGKLRFDPKLIPFRDIHLKSGFTSGHNKTGDMRYVYLFSAIAVLILLIACINYVNLSTARSLKRAKETGLRKVIGATRQQLIALYLTESVVLTTISVFLAFAIAERILPVYNDLIERELSLSYNGGEFIFTMIVINLLVGLAAGAYPALKLSSFKPIQALRGAQAPKGKKNVRRALVLTQFLIAQTLIVATIVIQSQLTYLQNKDLGYNKEHALYIDTHGELAENRAAFQEAIKGIPGVNTMAYSGGIFTYAAITFMELHTIEGNEEEEPGQYIIADLFDVDRDFLEVMEIDMVAGRNFSDSIDSDKREAVLINEATVKKFGWEQPIGKRIKVWGANRYVIGVMKDFHNESLRAEITPSFIVYDQEVSDFANIRISPVNVSETMDRIKEAWSAMVPDRPIEYTFYDDKFDQHYKSEKQLGEIFFIFAALAIGISLLGLIGLTAFTAEQRLKEIGIRKVLGAPMRKLMMLLSSEFVTMCSVAFIITTPITYYLMQNWLKVFKYHVNIGLPVYLIALLASLGVGWLVVCFLSAKVARSNPAQILRTE